MTGADARPAADAHPGADAHPVGDARGPGGSARGPRSDEAGPADPMRGARAVRAALRRAMADGPPGWIVGGAVREALRGRPTDDVDVALAGAADDVRRVARTVARELGGHAFPLSDAFGAWRAASDGADAVAWQLDVTPLQGPDLATDLGRRDLTVNALAEPVDGGALVDLFGGRQDLVDGVLRLVAPDALERDPVRVVRLARFAAELDAAPDDAAVAAARAAARALPAVPGERVLPELLRALTGPGWARGLDVLDATGALAALLPAAGAAERVRAPLGRLLEAPAVEGAAAADAAALRDRAARPTRRAVLVLATLLADAPDPGAALDGLRPSRELRSGVSRAVAGARRIAALGPGDHDAEALHAALGPAGTDAPEAVLLAAARDPDAPRPWPALAARAVRWADGPPRPPVDGGALAEALGLRPGPELGRLLRAVAIAYDAGELRDADEAVRWARARRDAEGDGYRRAADGATAPDG